MARIIISHFKGQPGCVCIFGCVPLLMFAAVQPACRSYPPSLTPGGVMPSDRDPLTVRDTRYQRNAIRSTLFWCFLAPCQQQYHYYVKANWGENCRPMKNVLVVPVLNWGRRHEGIWWNGDIAPHIPTIGTRVSGQLNAWPLYCLRRSL